MSSQSQASSPDVQPMRDNNPTTSQSENEHFFNGRCDRYTVLECVGKGSYGTVCSAVDNVTGEKASKETALALNTPQLPSASRSTF